MGVTARNKPNLEKHPQTQDKEYEDEAFFGKIAHVIQAYNWLHASSKLLPFMLPSHVVRYCKYLHNTKAGYFRRFLPSLQQNF